MRAWLVAMCLLGVALAGCAETTVQDPVPSPAPPHEEPARTEGNNTHPAYGYPTEDDLEEANETQDPPPVDDEPEPVAEDNGTEAHVAEEAPAPPRSKWRKPPHRGLPETLSGLEHITRATGPSGGAGIGLFGPLAFVGPTSGPMTVLDIMDPTNPRAMATLDVPARDVDTILYPDDRLIVVTTGGGRDMYFTDATEPSSPFLLTTLSTPHTNHNLAVVPGTPIVYNAPSGGSVTDIIDASDPANPVMVKEWSNGDACHDVDFFYDHERSFYRGYCAGLDVVQIWDIKDPTSPRVVKEIPFPGGGVEGGTGVSPVTFAHLATINHDGSILIVGDETGGGLAPGCDAYAHAAGTTVSGPLGNLWFYDITDEQDPRLVGHVSPGIWEDTGTCTAHFGGVIEDRDHAAMAFYNHGVLLIDFTDPSDPVIKDRIGQGDVWDVQYYQGYLFTGDMGRGLDVLGIT